MRRMQHLITIYAKYASHYCLTWNRVEAETRRANRCIAGKVWIVCQAARSRIIRITVPRISTRSLSTNSGLASVRRLVERVIRNGGW